MILFAIGAIPILLLLGTIHAAGRRHIWEKVIMSIADGFLIVVCLMFLIELAGISWHVIAVWIGFAIAIEIWIIGWMWHWWRKRRRMIALLTCFALLVCARLGSEAYTQYLNNISYDDYFNPAAYYPTREGSLAIESDEPSELNITENMPVMDGATALCPVYAAFAKTVYPKDMPENVFQCNNTYWAYKYIVDGRADIIFAAMPSKEQEAYAREKGVELVYTPIGKEAFVFFVNPKNPVENLTSQQVRDIYAGKITKWSEVGVQGMGSIAAFQRSEGSGSQTALERYVMGDIPLMDAPQENVFGDMGGIVRRTADYKNFKNAIGYSFRFYCTELMQNFDVKLLSIDGVAPTVGNIENETYPYSAEFYAVTRSDATRETLALLEWICGRQGQTLTERVGYTPYYEY